MLVEHYRHGLIEEEHSGYVMTLHKGDVNDYPYYLRSCAKPLQASIIEDFKTKSYILQTPFLPVFFP